MIEYDRLYLQEVICVQHMVEKLSIIRHPLSRMRLMYSLIGAAVLGLAAHGFVYLNYMPAHDMLNYIDYFAGGWEFSLGRFTQPLYGILRGSYTMPWLSGLLTMLFCGLASFLVCDLLDIENRWLILCSAGFLIANATMTEIGACFLYVSDAFALALLLSCAGAYVLIRMKGVLSVLLSCALMVLAMGMYQSYILPAVALLLFYAMKRALSQRSLWTSEWRSWFRWIIALALTAVVYFGVYVLILRAKGMSAPDQYNSPARLATFSIAEILGLVKNAYSSFAAFFFGLSQNGFTLFYACNLLLAAAVCAGLVRCIIRRKLPLFNLCVLGIGMIVFPALAQTMSILARNQITYFLTAHTLFLMYPGAISFAREKRAQLGALALSILLLFSSIKYSNELYTLQKVHYDKALSHVTRVMDRMDLTEGYVPGQTPVAAVGVFSHAMNDLNRPEAYRWTEGTARSAVTYTMTFGSFVRMLGAPIHLLNDEEIGAYAAMEEVQKMPAYPAGGCCRMIGDVLVVKFPN